MVPKKICVGIQNFKFACSKICGYLKVVGTCSQNGKKHIWKKAHMFFCSHDMQRTHMF